MRRSELLLSRRTIDEAVLLLSKLERSGLGLYAEAPFHTPSRMIASVVFNIKHSQWWQWDFVGDELNKVLWWASGMAGI